MSHWAQKKGLIGREIVGYLKSRCFVGVMELTIVDKFHPTISIQIFYNIVELLNFLAWIRFLIELDNEAVLI